MVMNYKRKAALCACSDFLDPGRMADIERLRSILESEGVHVEVSPLLYGSGGHDMGQKKANIVNAYFRDPEMDYIFDVSGGDLANTVLPYLDYEAVRASRALFFGYSDLTTVLNAVISKTGRETVNWQVRNLLYDHAQEQLGLDEGQAVLSKGGEGEIDAITASTITSRAFLKAVNQAYIALTEKDTDAKTGATQKAVKQ